MFLFQAWNNLINIRHFQVCFQLSKKLMTTLFNLPNRFADPDPGVRVTCGAPLLLSQQCSQYLRLNHIPQPASQWENCLMVSLSLSRPYLRYSPYLGTWSTQTSHNLCRFITFEKFFIKQFYSFKIGYCVLIIKLFENILRNYTHMLNFKWIKVFFS